ncbi:CCAAT-binding factor complex subunit Php2 [Schizosaccharomyces cryophilus OY26]|uniref:Transcriptional activator HAP2 n=1 Tax=Schizosaccharomyces cryophilus (strain OY26 / ATCC MYA-4695 / CBS 11777 / NBRC 106824 / NRRL Y48691) TaxID=653667 RepID=S9VT98_SCHCR|nr:CCAAT-binding factor complex subunit Php2 [Schizosaccharomyces cryophilus OY26]EPY49334.1 CCAAT-binding factor complex subunit Php2 [Schizosaccharomyces cryophilus OY26]
MNPYEPVEGLYVNAKQYHRILKRREARARLEERLRGMQTTKKPYLHESRHKHAMRRPRGPGGRFLTAEKVSQLKAQEALEEGKSESPNGSETRGLMDTLDTAPTTTTTTNEFLDTNDTADDSPSSTLSSHVPNNAAGGPAGLDLTGSREETQHNPSIFGTTTNSNFNTVSANPNPNALTHPGGVDGNRSSTPSAAVPSHTSTDTTNIGPSNSSINAQIHNSTAATNNQHHRHSNAPSNAPTLTSNENIQLRNASSSAVSNPLSVNDPGVDLNLSNPIVMQLDPSNLLHSPSSNQNTPRTSFFPPSTTTEDRPSPPVSNRHHSTANNTDYGNLPTTTHPNSVFHKNATHTYHTTPGSELTGPNGDSFADLDVYQTDDPVTTSLIHSQHPIGSIGDLSDPSTAHGSGIPNLTSHHMGHLNLTGNNQDSIIIDQQPYTSHDSTSAHP